MENKFKTIGSHLKFNERVEFENLRLGLQSFIDVRFYNGVASRFLNRSVHNVRKPIKDYLYSPMRRGLFGS